MKKLFFMMMAASLCLSVSATKYQKVTSVSELADGDIVVMANESAGKISSAVATTGKYIEATAATIAEGYAEADGATEITLIASGTSWKLKVGTKTIGNNDNTDLNVNGNGTLTYNISFDESGNVLIANTVSTNGTFYYNGAGTGRFKTYISNTMAPVQLYKKVAGSNPVMTLDNTELVFDTKALADGTATDQKTLTISASDLKETNITVAMKNGTVFSVTPASVTYTGGTVTIAYTATAEGTYTDTVVVTGTTYADTAIVAECVVSVTINPTAPTGVDVTYNLLQSVDSLYDGVKVFFGTAAKDYVLGLYESGSNIKGVAATYTTDRHQVTANDLNAYTVSIVDGKYVFTGTDGKYLYMFNTNKNLSSSTSLNNQAEWTVAIADDVATIKSVYSSSFAIYFNKTATTPLFCTYQSTPSTDANIAGVVIYSSNAPEYQEKVLHPAFDVLVNGVAVGDTLDWGEVVYDDSYGTEVAPYSEAKTLTVKTTDLSQPISVAISGDTAFTIYTTSIPAAGGSVTVNFETTSVGSYEAVVTLTYDTLVKTIVVKAKAVKEITPDPSTLPTLNVSEESIDITLNLENNPQDIVSFDFSALNLDKTLYVKWLKNNNEPSAASGVIEMMVGDTKIGAGETAQFAAPTVDTTEVLISVTAYAAFTYSTSLQFYSYKADSKTEYAINKSIPVNITVTATPTALEGVENDAAATKVIRNAQVLILRDGRTYNLVGAKVE